MITPVIYTFDDDETVHVDVRDALDRVLQPGFSFPSASVATPIIREASDEEACLKLIREFRRDTELPLFVVDISFPGNDNAGFNILQAIRKKRQLRFAPVIMLTSYGETDFVNSCYQIGANCYIVKDNDPEKLQNDLNTLIRFWLLNVCHNRALNEVGRAEYVVESG